MYIGLQILNIAPYKDTHQIYNLAFNAWYPVCLSFCKPKLTDVPTGMSSPRCQFPLKDTTSPSGSNTYKTNVHSKNVISISNLIPPLVKLCLMFLPWMLFSYRISVHNCRAILQHSQRILIVRQTQNLIGKHKYFVYWIHYV